MHGTFTNLAICVSPPSDTASSSYTCSVGNPPCQWTLTKLPLQCGSTMTELVLSHVTGSAAAAASPAPAASPSQPVRAEQGSAGPSRVQDKAALGHAAAAASSAGDWMRRGLLAERLYHDAEALAAYRCCLATLQVGGWAVLERRRG
jgi:hypothetical protein